MTIDDTTTPADVREALVNLAQHAARQPHTLGWRSWEDTHRTIDALLDELEIMSNAPMKRKAESGAT